MFKSSEKGVINRKLKKNRINNFVFTAYNNVVETITVAQCAQNGQKDLYIPYVYKKLKEKFGFQDSECRVEYENGENFLIFQGGNGLCSRVKKSANEYISDVLSIGYKYDFFRKNLPLPLLSDKERFLLYVALVAADYHEDKRYILHRLDGLTNCSINGVFNFRLRELKSRWTEVIEYIPADFGKYSLEGFLDYVATDGEGRAYLKDGKVYDENYRLMDKSSLLGKNTPIADILLSGVNQVYCFGETDVETKTFLKKYYKDKAIFC